MRALATIDVTREADGRLAVTVTPARPTEYLRPYTHRVWRIDDLERYLADLFALGYRLSPAAVPVVERLRRPGGR
jgi:hypothetical protein